MITIRDVAARAQVSTGTVSRVLNNHPSVNPAIRRVVLEVIKELQFQPNAVARTLRTAKTRTLGLLLADLRNSEVAATAIWGAESIAQQHGYALLVADSRRDTATEVQHLRSLLERRIDGLLCSSMLSLETVHDFAQRTGVPTVVYGQSAPNGLLPTTVVSYAQGAEEAVDHLVGLGHRRIGTIMRPMDIGVENRIGQMQPHIHRLLHERGIESDGEFDRAALSPADCTRVVQELLTGNERPTALFVTSLYLIPATIAGIRAAGAHIPRDVSLIGFGDSDWAEVVEPPLNVIVVDYSAHLEAATRMLIGLIERGDEPPLTVEHHGHYIRRGSVQPPPRRHRTASVNNGHDAIGITAAE
jgi:LacI family transcriptional regulator